jgi:hypothetical protein
MPIIARAFIPIFGYCEQLLSAFEKLQGPDPLDYQWVETSLASKPNLRYT